MEAHLAHLPLAPVCERLEASHGSAPISVIGSTSFPFDDTGFDIDGICITEGATLQRSLSYNSKIERRGRAGAKRFLVEDDLIIFIRLIAARVVRANRSKS